MKTIDQVKEELGRQFEKRLKLRKDRKLKKTCRNCKIHKEIEIDLGDFGKQTRYICSEQYDSNNQDCRFFKSLYSEEMIKNEMLNDIKDPAICGAKEPKIAALLWVLHEDDNLKKDMNSSDVNTEEDKNTRGIFSWLGSLFK